MVAIAVSLILLVLIGFLLVFVIKSLAAPKKLDGINKLIKQQKYAAAQKAAKSLIAKDPMDYHAHYYLGKAYQALKDYENAIYYYKLMLEVCPNSTLKDYIPQRLRECGYTEQ